MILALCPMISIMQRWFRIQDKVKRRSSLTTVAITPIVLVSLPRITVSCSQVIPPSPLESCTMLRDRFRCRIPPVITPLHPLRRKRHMGQQILQYQYSQRTLKPPALSDHPLRRKHAKEVFSVLRSVTQCMLITTMKP